MNLIEAIKSGKPFRRPDFAPNWFWWTDMDSIRCGYYPKIAYNANVPLSDYTASDLTATDWESRETEVSITPKQFYEALRQAYVAETKRPGLRDTAARYGGYSYDEHNFIIDQLRQNLGLR